MGSGPYKINRKYYDIGKDDISISVPSDEVWDGHGPFTLRQTEPWPDAIRLGLLKSAYLMVFSLLGAAGYRYAQGEAVTSIRDQLLSCVNRLCHSALSWITASTLKSNRLSSHSRV